MPELPEVEVTRRKLWPQLEGRVISHVATTRPSYFFLSPPAVLKKRLPGKRVRSLDRKGKYLLLRFDDDTTLLLHLGMTGQLFTQGTSSPRLLRKTGAGTLLPTEQNSFTPDAHTHLCLFFEDDGPAIFFRDVRKFGKVRLLPRGASDARLDKLGPDALSVTGEQLHGTSRGRKIPLKTFLLDQQVVAGIGNIYADEALFLARLSPRKPATRTSRPAYERLGEAIQTVLERSIATGGSSISDYISPDGHDGAYQDERRVYGRSGLPCLICGSAIQRVILAQRSTHYCARCQR